MQQRSENIALLVGFISRHPLLVRVVSLFHCGLMHTQVFRDVFGASRISETESQITFEE